MKPPTGARVVVGMSGGVDSSVAAALLKEEGYDVIGVMLRLWSDEGAENRCCSPDAQQEARYIAGLLGIPFYVLDARDSFYKSVVLPFIESYTAGTTPNPCLNCNRFVRWGFLLDRAETLGAEYIATGHYARIQQSPDGEMQLLKGKDLNKDQSYVLHVLMGEILSRTYFPLGLLTKNQVREIADQHRLPVADRPDSQDLCFVGQGDYRNFLRKVEPSLIKPGPIMDQEGNQIGEHNGLVDYTIGQRKGLGISGPEPYYVMKKQPAQNVLVVGYKKDLGRKDFYADQVNWISGKIPPERIEAMIKIRYKSPEIPGTVKVLKGNSVKIKLESPLPDITPGQAAVFYQGNLCLGGGIIRAEDR